MSSLLSAIGLAPTPTGLQPPNHAVTFLFANWAIAHLFTSSRTLKGYYGFDNNAAPRQDISVKAERMIKEGKITKREVDRIRRLEAAHANSVENFPIFFGTLVLALHARLPSSTINTFGAIYTVARIVYAIAYTTIERGPISLVRSSFWWVGNIACFWIWTQCGTAVNK